VRPPTKRPTRALFWDIDGTLLVTGRAGMIAWERAFIAHTGATTLPVLRTDGLTDHQIAASLLGHPRLDTIPSDEVQADAARLVARYAAELPAALPLRQGRVLEHVIAILDLVPALDRVALSWLVTGNTQGGGTAKLGYYGLARYFRDRADEAGLLMGAFSERVEPRAHIVRRALELAQARLPGLTAEEVLVVGDTPHDIEGAHAIGVPVLAVATNAHNLDELGAYAPWRVLPRLPEPADFGALIAGLD
jgi:phosphoglycolate phosphatase